MANLQTAGVGFRAVFQEALKGVAPDHARISMAVNSTTAKEEYGWLGDLPGVREWLGDRVIHKLGTYDYSIRNRDFESTVEVDRNDIEDDNLGLYAPRFRQMGQRAGEFPSTLVYEALVSGFAAACYDGQFFFDTDHPVLDAAGNPQSVANTDAVAGNGEPWFLFDTRQAVKPLILQTRKAFDFQQMDDPKDANVFLRRKFLYGVDGRMNAGFGLWQLAWGSKQTLNATNFETAITSMMAMKGDFGRRLAIRPDLLVTGPKNMKAARELLKKERLANGEDNIWKDEVELLVTPWLA